MAYRRSHQLHILDQHLRAARYKDQLNSFCTYLFASVKPLAISDWKRREVEISTEDVAVREGLPGIVDGYRSQTMCI